MPDYNGRLLPWVVRNSKILFIILPLVGPPEDFSIDHHLLRVPHVPPLSIRDHRSVAPYDRTDLTTKVIREPAPQKISDSGHEEQKCGDVGEHARRDEKDRGDTYK